MSKPLERFIKILEKKMDGRTQRWLAAHSNVSQSKLSRILAAQTEPDLSEILGLAKALECQPHELLMPPPHPRLSDLATETIEPPPAPPTTFTLDEMRAAIRDEIQATLDVERLRLENERLKAELASSNAPFTPVDAFGVLDAFQKATPEQRALAMTFLTLDESHLAPFPEYRDMTAEALAKAK